MSIGIGVFIETLPTFNSSMGEVAYLLRLLVFGVETGAGRVDGALNCSAFVAMCERGEVDRLVF